MEKKERANQLINKLLCYIIHNIHIIYIKLNYYQIYPKRISKRKYNNFISAMLNTKKFK
jgi:hypothetical protein